MSILPETLLAKSVITEGTGTFNVPSVSDSFKPKTGAVPLDGKAKDSINPPTRFLCLTPAAYLYSISNVFICPIYIGVNSMKETLALPLGSSIKYGDPAVGPIKVEPMIGKGLSPSLGRMNVELANEGFRFLISSTWCCV